MGARNGFKLQDTASLFNLLGQFDQLIRSVAEDEVWVQIPVTRSKRKGHHSVSFSFWRKLTGARNGFKLQDTASNCKIRLPFLI
ncbi:MAG: hypothetical protein IKV50_05930, partial [Clostridia bacterium]|nr:hypothetical protein [Clostridia bacterium]